jgi:hypothetical protein
VLHRAHDVQCICIKKGDLCSPPLFPMQCNPTTLFFSLRQATEYKVLHKKRWPIVTAPQPRQAQAPVPLVSCSCRKRPLEKREKDPQLWPMKDYVTFESAPLHALVHIWGKGRWDGTGDWRLRDWERTKEKETSEKFLQLRLGSAFRACSPTGQKSPESKERVAKWARKWADEARIFTEYSVQGPGVASCLHRSLFPLTLVVLRTKTPHGGNSLVANSVLLRLPSAVATITPQKTAVFLSLSL